MGWDPQGEGPGRPSPALLPSSSPSSLHCHPASPPSWGVLSPPLCVSVHPPPRGSLGLSWASCPPASLRGAPSGSGSRPARWSGEGPLQPSGHVQSPDRAVEVRGECRGFGGNASVLCAENRGPHIILLSAGRLQGTGHTAHPCRRILTSCGRPSPPRPTLGCPGQLSSALRLWRCQACGPQTSAHTRPTQGLGQETLARPWLGGGCGRKQPVHIPVPSGGLVPTLARPPDRLSAAHDQPRSTQGGRGATMPMPGPLPRPPILRR